MEMGASPSLRDLPEPSIELSNKSLMAGFNALTELYVIVGKVLRTVYAVDAVESCKESVERTQAQVASLDKELTDWCERLPATFKSDPKSPQQISLGALNLLHLKILCSSYYSALITLHRNFLPTKRKGSPNPNWASVPKAVFASRSCILLSLTTKEAIPRSHHLAFFTQALFSAAVIILLCARFATVESAARTASEEVNTALVCLDGLDGAWPGARKCKELLQELVEATRQAMRVQVPGVGRPGNVNGLVDPTPPGVEKVQTVYNSFKRAANEGEQPAEAPPEEPEAGPDEKQPRKIKGKPRSKSKPRRQSDSPSPPSTNGSGNASIGDMDMDYLVHDPHEPQSPSNQSARSLNNYVLSQQQTPQSLMKLAQSSPGSTYNQGTPSVFGNSAGVPHDWLPSPTVDSFGNMAQFNNDIFANVPPSLMSLSQPQSPIASHRFSNKGGAIGDLSPPLSSAAVPTFDFSSTNLPFGGFDFLQGFSTGTGSTNGGPAGGFDAGNAAAWTDFVGTGVFNNVPDQPFNLTEHDHEAIIGMTNDGDD
ncbi:hypothetical protein FRC00_000909 [Tulasnella sp. 408]|nr:hypothetical protein FRC00_000909 [Tulasnella sp. 408]